MTSPPPQTRTADDEEPEPIMSHQPELPHGTMHFRPLVLCYHAVSVSWMDPLAVSAVTVERQVRRLIRRGYRPVAAADTLANDRRTMHVTFDDAYRNIAPALDALERLRVPVTVFSCTDHAQDGRRLDVPELRHRAPRESRELDTMTWDTLRELADRGVEIGSHTVSHPHLPTLDDAELASELRSSRERIEDELQRPCRFLAYPYGEDDQRVHAAAREAGYSAAFTLSPPDGRTDVFALPRIDIYRGDNAARFALKTAPGRRSLVALTHVLRRARRVADRRVG